MLDLTIFQNRLFAAATAAAFINGLSRFALLFLFVFYFQGVKGDDPIKAGIELAPMAIGMLIASPLAGIWADRRGSRALAAWGMVLGAVALAGMTTLGVHTPYVWSALWLFVVGVGVGHVQQPEHGGDDGDRAGAPARDRRRRADDAAEHGRGDLDRLRAGHRHLVGATRTRCSRSSPASPPGSSDADAGAVRGQHAHGAVGARGHLGGRRRRLAAAARRGTEPCGSASSPRAAGTTPRTVRYYEEIGLLAAAGERSAGEHREYTDDDVERLRELLRLKRLLGLSLDELRDVMHGEEARAERRRAWPRDDRPGRAPPDPARGGARTPTRCSRTCAAARRSSRASRPSSTSAASSMSHLLRELVT